MGNVVFKWRDQNYAVKEDAGIMRLISDVWKIAPLEKLANNQVEMPDLAAAYGLVLRYAGADVDDVEIFREFFKSETAEHAVNCCTGLMVLMMGPEALEEPATKKPVKKARKKIKKA